MGSSAVLYVTDHILNQSKLSRLSSKSKKKKKKNALNSSILLMAIV